MKRVHRTFWERFYYLAIYECRNCHHERGVPRHYRYHFGPVCRCPKCGTQRLKKLKDKDPIDPMHSGFLNLMERLAGGARYHCCFCRIQFFDRRAACPPGVVLEGPEEQDEEVMSPQDTASSGA